MVPLPVMVYTHDGPVSNDRYLLSALSKLSVVYLKIMITLRYIKLTFRKCNHRIAISDIVAGSSRCVLVAVYIIKAS